MTTEKGGPPRWYPPDSAKVEELASTGLTMEQIANCLGIHMSTLCKKRHEFKEFDQAIKRGKDKGIQVISNALFEAGRNGNITAQIFFLKARADWKEAKAEQEHVVSVEEKTKKIREADETYNK